MQFFETGPFRQVGPEMAPAAPPAAMPPVTITPRVPVVTVPPPRAEPAVAPAFPRVTIPPAEPFVTVLPGDPCAPLRQRAAQLEQALGLLNQFTQVAIREYRQSQAQNTSLQARIAQLQQAPGGAVGQAPRIAQLEQTRGQLTQLLQAVRDQNGQVEGQNRTLQFVASDAQGRLANVIGELDQCQLALRGGVSPGLNPWWRALDPLRRWQ